jgi:hypothetical protein
VPDWDSELVQAVKAEFGDDQDPLTLVSWKLAALLAGAQLAADLVPLSRELDRMLALLRTRRGPSEADELDELTARRREKASQARS